VFDGTGFEIEKKTPYCENYSGRSSLSFILKENRRDI
jgi:hypothetical protein